MREDNTDMFAYLRAPRVDGRHLLRFGVTGEPNIWTGSQITNFPNCLLANPGKVVAQMVSVLHLALHPDWALGVGHFAG